MAFEGAVMPKKSGLSKLELAYVRDAAQAKTVEDLKLPWTRHIYVLPASPAEVKSTRAKLKQSQRKFSDWLGVSVQTVQAWEAGRRSPEAIASKVIRYAASHPDWVRDFSAPELWGKA
jgi:DNA-binding transcriptional regulator YiaG